MRAQRRAESDDEDSDDVDMGENIDELVEFERATRLESKKQAEEEPVVEDSAPKGLIAGFEVANPNAKKQNKMLKTKDLKNMGDVNVEETLTRREREVLEAERKRAEYQRRHAAGETDQAKADLARLQEVRRRREEARIKCEAEGRKPGWTENGVESDESDDDSEDEKPKAKPAPVMSEAAAKKKKAAMEAPEPTAEEPKLSSMEIKKMNADTLKEHLKKRGLSIQGQKKELIKRLTEFEAGR